MVSRKRRCRLSKYNLHTSDATDGEITVESSLYQSLGQVFLKLRASFLKLRARFFVSIFVAVFDRWSAPAFFGRQTRGRRSPRVRKRTEDGDSEEVVLATYELHVTVLFVAPIAAVGVASKIPKGDSDPAVTRCLISAFSLLHEVHHVVFDNFKIVFTPLPSQSSGVGKRSCAIQRRTTPVCFRCQSAPHTPNLGLTELELPKILRSMCMRRRQLR